MAETKPSYEQALCYTAAEDRAVFADLICVEGVADREGGDLLVTTTGAAGPSVSVAAGGAWIEGNDVANQGMYHVFNDGPDVITLDSADAANPRIDLIVATVRDAQYSGTNNDWVNQRVSGVATAGASLANLSGAAAVPANSIPLAYVLVPAGSGTNAILAANILDARTSFVKCGNAGLLTTVVMNASGTFDKANYPGGKRIRVRIQAGGGGSGGYVATAAGEASGGGGGGGGAYVEGGFRFDQLAASEVVTVGAAGAAAAAGGGGGTGGASRFGTTSALMTQLDAAGGSGGLVGGVITTPPGTNGGSGGIGGSGTGGSLQIPGARGGTAQSISAARVEGGFGGTSFMGPGAHITLPSAGTATAQAGPNYGAGGNGGANIGASAGNKAGAAGGPGIVLIDVFG